MFERVEVGVGERADVFLVNEVGCGVLASGHESVANLRCEVSHVVGAVGVFVSVLVVVAQHFLGLVLVGVLRAELQRVAVESAGEGQLEVNLGLPLVLAYPLVGVGELVYAPFAVME